MFLRVVNVFAGALLAAAVIFASATDSRAQDSYVIRSGDTLQIEVLEDPSLNRNTLVLPDGMISFPMVGTVPAKGRSVEELRQSLVSSLGPNFATSPNVYVSVASLADQQPLSSGRGSGLMDVYALGEITAPGRVEVKRGTTLLQFLAESGGLTKFAAEKRIELHRTDPKTGAVTSYLFNYRTPAGGPSGISGSTRLASGDVIKVPQRRLFE